jgi:hypothetical protein
MSVDRWRKENIEMESCGKEEPSTPLKKFRKNMWIKL